MNREPEQIPSEPATAPPSTGRRRSGSIGGFISWIVLLAIAASAVALVAAHLPPIFKKLGLFAVAYGLILGLIGAWLQQFTPGLARRRRLATAVVVLLAVLGEIGIATESFRIERKQQSGRELADPKQLLAKKLLESAAEPSDSKSQETLNELRRTYSGPGASFGDYLQYRVSGVGIHSQRMAALFWGIELLLGGLAAAWVFYRYSADVISATAAPPARLDAEQAPAKLEE